MLKCVFLIMIDNASFNDRVITHFKKKVKKWNRMVLNKDMMHKRCCSHILNLVVDEGLKDYYDSIFSIWHAIRYVKSSSSRLAKFKKAIRVENITSKPWCALMSLVGGIQFIKCL